MSGEPIRPGDPTQIMTGRIFIRQHRNDPFIGRTVNVRDGTARCDGTALVLESAGNNNKSASVEYQFRIPDRA